MVFEHLGPFPSFLVVSATPSLSFCCSAFSLSAQVMQVLSMGTISFNACFPNCTFSSYPFALLPPLLLPTVIYLSHFITSSFSFIQLKLVVKMAHCCSSTSSSPFFISLLLLVTLTQARHLLAEGRAMAAPKVEEEKAMMVEVRSMIGSRPPRCENKCMSCGHCEPVQVPAVPQEKDGARHFFFKGVSSSRDDSNYKPMSWKCKCGNLIINP